MTISDNSCPLKPSPNLIHALPPLPPATAHNSKPHYRTPLPRKFCPTVPVRRSSLERPDTTSMKNIKTQRINQKAGSHNLDRSDSHAKANNEEHLHEGEITPTNERIFVMETKVNKLRQIYLHWWLILSLQPESTSSSGSSNSSFSSGYGSVAMVSAHQAQEGQNAIT